MGERQTKVRLEAAAGVTELQGSVREGQGQPSSSTSYLDPTFSSSGLCVRGHRGSASGEISKQARLSKKPVEMAKQKQKDL